MRTCRECIHDEGSGTDATFCGVIRSLVSGHDNRDTCRAFIDRSAQTVAVRIAVAVTTEGDWDSRGYGWQDPSTNPDDEELSNYALQNCEDPTALVTFITAHVPVPQPQTAGETIGTVQS